MAEVNQTTEQTAQPMQQLSALEQAQLNDKRTTVTLDIEGVINQISMFSTTPQQYAATSRIQGNYYQIRFRGAIVNVPEKFFQDFQKKEVEQVSFTPTIYERVIPDPLVSGAKKTVIAFGWAYDNHTSLDDYTVIMAAKAKSRKTRAIAEQQLKKEFALADAIMAREISEDISDADIDAAIAAAIGQPTRAQA